MATELAYIGGGISIVGAIVAAWPALPTNADIEAEGNPVWDPNGPINNQGAMIQGRRFAIAGIILAVAGQVIGLAGS